VAINLFIGFSVPGIDNLGHLGGLIGGLILGWLLCPFYEVEAHPGEPQVVDRNSLRAEWRGITLFVVLLIAGVLGGLARYAAF
jgi:CDP-diglyceride synthetase